MEKRRLDKRTRVGLEKESDNRSGEQPEGVLREVTGTNKSGV